MTFRLDESRHLPHVLHHSNVCLCMYLSIYLFILHSQKLMEAALSDVRADVCSSKAAFDRVILLDNVPRAAATGLRAAAAAAGTGSGSGRHVGSDGGQ